MSSLKKLEAMAEYVRNHMSMNKHESIDSSIFNEPLIESRAHIKVRTIEMDPNVDTKKPERVAKKMRFKKTFSPNQT